MLLNQESRWLVEIGRRQLRQIPRELYAEIIVEHTGSSHYLAD